MLLFYIFLKTAALLNSDIFQRSVTIPITKRYGQVANTPASCLGGPRPVDQLS